MKKFTIIILALFFVNSEANAYMERACCTSEPKWYLGLGGAVSFINDERTDMDFASYPITAIQKPIKYDTGFGIHGKLGYHLMPSLRTELELGLLSAELNNKNDFIAVGSGNSSRVNATMLIVNGIYDFSNSSRWTPYLGAGAGPMYLKTPIVGIVTVASVETDRVRDKDWVWAYQFMAGTSYRLSPQVMKNAELYFGYRYLTSTEGAAEYKNYPGATDSFSITSHNAELGIRFSF